MQATLPGVTAACFEPPHLLPTKDKEHSGTELVGILLCGQLVQRKGTSLTFIPAQGSNGIVPSWCLPMMGALLSFISVRSEEDNPFSAPGQCERALGSL